jgi:hypothetical protein
MAKKIAKVPVEWVDGKIVLGAPADPISGRGNQRVAHNDFQWYLGFEVSRPLFQWFFNLLDEKHKTKAWDERSKVSYISPEATKLLKKNVDFFEDKFKDGKKSLGKIKKQELKMAEGDFETPPEWVGEKIVLPKPAESPNKKYYWKPNFDGENYKAVLWFRDHLPESHQGQITDPNNGYPAKTMSTEAGELWFKHKGFWLAQYFIPIKEKEAQKKEMLSVGQETLKNASAKAGVSLKELNQKLERLSTLAKGEDLDLAIRMVADFDDVWLFESLLAGSTIDKDGYLVPGKPLKMFKEHGEFFGILALVNAPESTNLHASLNKTKLQYFKINDPVLEMLDLYVKHIVKKCPTLKSMGHLNISGLKTLSTGTAKALSMHVGGLSLNGLKSLSDGAAEALSKHEGYLTLDGLKSLSDGAAEALSKHKGELVLRELKSLSDSPGHIGLAGKLASQEDLDLCGLTSLSDGAAVALSKRKGDLDLGGLKSLSDGAAKSLSKHEGELNLWGLESFSDSPGHVAVAEKIANQDGMLDLGGLVNLSGGAAEALSKHKGELDLSGLESLSDTAAEALSKCKCELDLSGLAGLSDAAAEALSKYKGRLSFENIKSLSDAASNSLSKHKGELDLRELKSLSDSPGHVALAKKLASQKGYLCLSGLASLSDAAAVAFSKHDGGLNFYGLKSLSDVAAEAFSKCNGYLDLSGLASLSDSAAEAFSKHKRDLHLNSLKSLSDAGAEALSKCEGDLNLSGLKSLSDAGAKALAKKKGGKNKMKLPSEIQKKVDKYRKK